jgi:hypothetical protein
MVVHGGRDTRHVCWLQKAHTASSVSARVLSTRDAFLALFREHVAAEHSRKAPKALTGFGLFCQEVRPRVTESGGH